MNMFFATWQNRTWAGENHWVSQMGMYIEPYYGWRYMAFLLVFLLIQGGVWLLWGQGVYAEWQQVQQHTLTLKQRYQQQWQQNQRSEQLQAQLQVISARVQTLEAQLPNAAEMDNLLSAINQAGLGRSLQFELFKPLPVEFKTDYAEQRIELRLTGLYEDIGAFAADVANLDRIMVLTDLHLTPVVEKTGLLTLVAAMRTFRYLAPEERLAPPSTAAASNEKKSKKNHKGKNHDPH